MLIKCLGAGIVLVLASLSDAFAEIVISEDQEFRILSGPVWTDRQNFAFSIENIESNHVTQVNSKMIPQLEGSGYTERGGAYVGIFEGVRTVEMIEGDANSILQNVLKRWDELGSEEAVKQLGDQGYECVYYEDEAKLRATDGAASWYCLKITKDNSIPDYISVILGVDGRLMKLAQGDFGGKI